MGELVANNKALLLKVLTYVLSTGFLWANKKYSLGVDPGALAATTASLILGIALHAAAKDHGLNVSDDSSKSEGNAK